MTKSALDEIEDMVDRLCDATRDREHGEFAYRKTHQRYYDDARQAIITAFLRISSEPDEMVERCAQIVESGASSARRVAATTTYTDPAFERALAELVETVCTVIAGKIRLLSKPQEGGER